MAKLTFAAYARHRGVSPATVTKAVAAGRISTEVDPRTARRVIDPDVADREWDERTDRSKQEGPKAYQRQRRRDAAPTEEPTKDDQSEDPTTDGASPAPPHLSEGSASASLALSKARREHWNAEMARLKFEQQTGKLVEAEEVKRQAFAVGRVVRESMLNLPDRLAALLAGETDPARVHAALTDEIIKALEALAHG